MEKEKITYIEEKKAKEGGALNDDGKISASNPIKSTQADFLAFLKKKQKLKAKDLI